MSTIAPGQLLRRHALPFGVSFVSLTALLVINYVSKRTPAPTGLLVDLALFAVPFTAAMTIPVSVLLAVLVVFRRLGSEGVLDAARHMAGGVRRLLTPVLGAAAVLAAVTAVVNSEVVPRSNARLASVSAGATHQRGDRELTIAELRSRASVARASTSDDGQRIAARYEVEVQKKLALAAAVIVLALTGAALAFLFPRGGAALLIGASCVVIGGYYACLVAGESLADRLVLSPFVGMWMANAALVAFAFMVIWWRTRGPLMPQEVGGAPLSSRATARDLLSDPRGQPQVTAS